MPRKLLLLCIAFCCFAQTTLAKKAFLSMQILAGTADVIVTGKITGVSGNSYVLGIDQVIKGNVVNKITVKMFAEWTCDYRWKKPVPGQELLLFLTKTNSDTFEIINGSTGEIFIIADTLHSIWDFKQQVKIADVITALKHFVTSYVVIKSDNAAKKGFVFNQLKPDAEIDSFKKLNDFSSWLFNGMKDYGVKKKFADVVGIGYGKSYYT